MSVSEHQDQAGDETILAFKEVAATSDSPTILFIHGAHSSGHEWDKVSQYLNNQYHLLIPDLPGHGRSNHLRPFDRNSSIRLLADLIRRQALHGKAHIVGHSLGASLAIDLAVNHPDTINTVFVSGYGAFSSPRTLAYGLYVDSLATATMPSSVVRWLMDGTDVSTSSGPNLALSKEIANAMCLGEDGWPKPWSTRTLIIAAGKSGILPTADNAEAAKKLRDIGRQGSIATIACTHPQMRHPWNMQDPKLYAETIQQWIAKGTVPSGFRML